MYFRLQVIEIIFWVTFARESKKATLPKNRLESFMLKVVSL